MAVLGRIKAFILGLIVGSVALGWFAYTHYVVRSADGISVLPKSEGTFQQIYVDVTQWGTMDFFRNRDLTKALAKNGLKQAQQSANETLDRVKEDASKEIEELKKGLDSITHPPSPGH